MKCDVTVKSFEDHDAYDFLIPSIEPVICSVVSRLATLTEPPINISGLNTVHVTENYREELFAFQQLTGHAPYTTQNKFATGYAQVVHVKESDDSSGSLSGYHIFINKRVLMVILVIQFYKEYCDQRAISEELMNQMNSEMHSYLRILRHELVHVEDKTNQEQMLWISELNTKGHFFDQLRIGAIRLWDEYYACKRSIFDYDTEVLTSDFARLVDDLNTIEGEICELRWQYNTTQITLDVFLHEFTEYIKTGLIFCCYYVGHTDSFFDILINNLNFEEMHSRFIPLLPRLWNSLKELGQEYPNWTNKEVLDDLMQVLLDCIEAFDVFPQDTAEGMYYSIPVKRLARKTAHENNERIDDDIKKR